MAYEQKRQRFEIVVTKENGVAMSSKEPSNSPKKENNTPTKSGLTEKQFNRMVRVNATKSLATGLQVIGQSANYIVGGVGISGGDSNYQDVIERKIEIARDVVNPVKSATMGAFYGFVGSGGNPIGAILGATLNVIPNLTSTTYKYAQRERQYKVDMFKQNNIIEYNRARAGVNLVTGRLR